MTKKESGAVGAKHHSRQLREPTERECHAALRAGTLPSRGEGPYLRYLPTRPNGWAYLGVGGPMFLCHVYSDGEVIITLPPPFCDMDESETLDLVGAAVAAGRAV